MIDILRQAWDFVLYAASSMGALWQTALLCLLLSLAVTQWVKPWVCTPDPFFRDRIVQLAAFAFGSIPVVAFEPTLQGFLVGVLVGFASPIVFSISQWAIRKRWPDLADALSADFPNYGIDAYMSGRKRPFRRR